MKVDVAKMTVTAQQVLALANIGGAVVSAGVGVVTQVLALLKEHGYDVDTQHLDELIADAERRRQLAEQEKNAQR